MMDTYDLASVHFISGLLRSGSTLLTALLRQRPHSHATMTSPVGRLYKRLLEGMSGDEFSTFITLEQQREILLNVFTAYPTAKVICCVRNIAWIMDSLERLIRSNALNVSGMFNKHGEVATLDNRTEVLLRGDRLVGFAYNTLKEAFYSEQSDRLLVVEYDLLSQSI